MASWLKFILVIGVSTAMNTSDQSEELYIDYPFWESWKPSYYSIDIGLNIEDMLFIGEVKMTGTVLEDMNKLGLHSKVNISEGFYTINGNITQLDLNSALENCTSGVIIFMLEEIINKDVEFVLTIKYTGQMKGNTGLYMSVYDFNDEQTKVISAELQPVYARLVFPCIDIPSYKAVFEIKLGRPQSMKALSNMPLKSTSESDTNGLVWDSFYPTPKMSTYVVAIAIFDDLTSRTEQNNTVWLPEVNKDDLLMPSEILGILLNAMENYTKIEYHLPKMDLLFVPTKTAAAMESWGLITWSHSLLLIKNEMNEFDDELKFVVIMAHELVHQWLGNLVTCSYWCYLWLNEGITTHLTHVIIEKVFPESKAMELFLPTLGELIPVDFNDPFALVDDGFCHNEIYEYNFNINLYIKGAAITNMVENVIMNFDLFREGLQTYLRKNQFGSVTERELWESLETKIKNYTTFPEGESLESLMHSWTHNRGYPLVTVDRLENGILTVKQEPFNRKPELVELNTYWWVPLSYTTSDEKDFENTHLKEWLKPTNQSHQLAVTITNDEWIILNIQNKGIQDYRQT